MSGRFLGQIFKSLQGKLWSVAQPYLTSIIEGDIPGHTFHTVEGFAPVINTADQVMWAVPPATQTGYVFPAAPAVVTIVSDDAGDNLAGTGATEYTVTGLIAGYIRATEVIPAHATDGTIAVSGSTEFLRINEVEVTDAGTAEQNLGNITIKSGTDIVSYIEEDTNKSIVPVYTVPAGETFYVKKVTGSGAGGKNVHVHIFKREFGGLFTQEKHRTINNSPYEMSVFRFPEKTDIQVTVHSDINGGIGDVSMEGWLE
jgi:hypothetical protein